MNILAHSIGVRFDDHIAGRTEPGSQPGPTAGGLDPWCSLGQPLLAPAASSLAASRGAEPAASARRRLQHLAAARRPTRGETLVRRPRYGIRRFVTRYDRR
jgi:hypothetical protein